MAHESQNQAAQPGAGARGRCLGVCGRRWKQWLRKAPATLVPPAAFVLSLVSCVM